MTLTAAIEAYLRLKRSLGAVFTVQETILRAFGEKTVRIPGYEKDEKSAAIQDFGGARVLLVEDLETLLKMQQFFKANFIL